MKRLFPLYLFALVFVACNDKANDNTIGAEGTADKKETVDYKSVIEETNKAFANAALNGDSAGIVAVYHPDANIFPPNGEAVNSKTMASMMSQAKAMGVKTFSLTTKEVYEGDDVVTEVGTYDMGDGQKNIETGKYMVVWKKDGDKWKLYRDIWNTNTPPAPPAKK